MGERRVENKVYKRLPAEFSTGLSHWDLKMSHGHFHPFISQLHCYSILY
jgi:hypothetical protein